MTRTETLSAYEKGIPLAEAWAKFASADRQAELAGTRGFFESFAGQQLDDNPSKIFSAAKASFTSEQARQNLISKMRDEHLDVLFNGDLIAMGRRMLPSKGHYPVTIEPDYFDGGDIDWNRSTLRWENKLFLDVRVFSLSEISDGPGARKGSIDAIDAAIRELMRENRKFGRLHRQEACEQIRKKLGLEDIPGRGLSDKNLSKRIVFHCGPKAIRKIS
jgi:hypothetical protein